MEDEMWENDMRFLDKAERAGLPITSKQVRERLARLFPEKFPDEDQPGG